MLEERIVLLLSHKLGDIKLTTAQNEL